MKKKLLSITATFLLLTSFLGGCGQNEPAPAPTPGDEAEPTQPTGDYRTDLQMGTGSTGGTYYPLGQEMANVINEHADVEGINVSAVASGASVDNIARIGRGEFQLGMTVHVPAVEAIEGEGDFEDFAIENFGFMGHIYPEVMQIVTTANTGITSIEDLRGKRVAIGPPGSSSQTAARLILAAHGLEDGDYQAFEEGFGDATGRLQDGQLEASFGFLGLPASAVDELSRQRDVVFLSISDEALDTVEEQSRFERFEIPADAYDFMNEPVNTITAYAILVGSTDQISEEVGYEIVKGLYENQERITHTQGQHMTMENILNGQEGIPFHPGAERYYREQGLID